MADSFIQLYIHCVFAVQGRHSLISFKWKEELYKYITGIVQNNGHKLLSINGSSDHIHIFIGLKPAQSISELIMYIKKDSSTWINKNKLVPGSFSWQKGYGVFSYSQSHVDNVIKYIGNQEEHHSKKSFHENSLV